MTDSVLVVWDVAELPLRDLNALLRVSKRWAFYSGSPPLAGLDVGDAPMEEAPRYAEHR